MRGRSPWGCVQKIAPHDFRQYWDEWYMPKVAFRLVLGEFARSVTNSYGGLWWKHVSQL